MSQSIRSDFVGAVFGAIPRSELNELEKKTLDLVRSNPGAATALQQLSTVPGGVDALNRLLEEHPDLSPGVVWDLFQSAGQDGEVFRDGVNQYLDANPRAAQKPPTVMLASGEKAPIQKFSKVWFTPQVAAQLEQRGIPYPMEWFMVTGTGTGSDSGRPNDVTVVGSVGGRYTFDSSKPVISRVSNGF